MLVVGAAGIALPTRLSLARKQVPDPKFSARRGLERSNFRRRGRDSLAAHDVESESVMQLLIRLSELADR